MLHSRYQLLVGCWIVLIAVAGMSTAVMAQEADFTPHVIGVVPLSAGNHIWVEDSFAYAAGNDGVEIVDIQNPYAPVWAGRFGLPDGAYAVAVHEGIAYIGADQEGFVIVNVSNPSQPELLWEFPELGTVVSVLVDGNYAYVGVRVEGGANLRVFNISDLTTTALCGQLDDVARGRMGSMAVKDEYLFIADADRGVRIVNITIPSAPESIAVISQTYRTYDLMIYNEILFVACHFRGTYLFNISIPYQPQALGQFNDNLGDDGEAVGVRGDNDYLYIADHWHVELLNISSPSSISELGESGPISHAHKLTVQDGFVYVAAGEGLFILAFGGTHPIRPPSFLIYLIPVVIAIIAVTAGLVYRFHRARDTSSTT